MRKSKRSRSSQPFSQKDHMSHVFVESQPSIQKGAAIPPTAEIGWWVPLPHCYGSSSITSFYASIGGILPASVELRQVNFVNNLMEHDHRFIKRLVKLGMGFFSFETAWRTFQGYEIMNMIRKGQAREVRKGDSPGQAAFIAHLFGIGA